MNIVVAIDSFKGSMTSLEAGNSIAQGIRKAAPDANVVVRPIADGGEGTMDALIEGMQGAYETITVTGPNGKPVTSQYGVIPGAGIAVVEMAKAAGLTLLRQEEKNPLYTTTYGVGEIVKDAIQKGYRRFIIGIGGSATNDVGIGFLQALGYHFLNAEGKEVPFGAIGVKDIADVRLEHVMPELQECSFRVACDVNNPLCGENGCSYVYARQKGATDESIREMDQWIRNYSNLLKEKQLSMLEDMPGAGAAGGLGYAFASFTNSKLESGIQIVLEETKLEEYIKTADIVITGEGRLDGQTVRGKAPVGVAKLAKKYNKKVIAFAGSVSEDAVLCNEGGIDAFFPILREVKSLEEVMQPENAKQNLTATAEQVMRLLLL